MDSNLKREIIIDNYQNPFHKKDVLSDSYIRVNTNNESCIDDIFLNVKFDGNKISDMYFSGEACAITTSATSIMIRNMIGKTIEEVNEMIDAYQNMIDEKEYDRDLLNDLVVYDETYKQANRKKCALMPFVAIKKAILKYQEK